MLIFTKGLFIVLSNKKNVTHTHTHTHTNPTNEMNGDDSDLLFYIYVKPKFTYRKKSLLDIKLCEKHSSAHDVYQRL